MKAVILCGGRGSRMADAGYEAKALVEVGGQPILWHIMKGYAARGVNEFVLTLGHGAAAVKRWFFEAERMGRDLTMGPDGVVEHHEPYAESEWRVTFVDTGLETNKGARLARVIDHVGDAPFHLTYGDGIGDVDLRELTAFHRAHGKLATVTGFQPWSQYGILNLDGDLVASMDEKPRLDDWINAGFIIFEPGVREYLNGDETLDLEKKVLADLAEDGQLAMYRHKGFWRSMDTFKEAQEMDQLWREGAPWKTW